MDHRAYEGSVGMLNTPYVKNDTIKNYFPLPNAIFDFGLHHMEINIYAYLLRIEDRVGNGEEVFDGVLLHIGRVQHSAAPFVCAVIHFRSSSFGTTMRLPIRREGKSSS